MNRLQLFLRRITGRGPLPVQYRSWREMAISERAAAIRLEFEIQTLKRNSDRYVVWRRYAATQFIVTQSPNDQNRRFRWEPRISAPLSAASQKMIDGALDRFIERDNRHA